MIRRTLDDIRSKTIFAEFKNMINLNLADICRYYFDTQKEPDKNE